jgi:glycosyltransferase involved in cell wall biosynthesis
VGAEVSPRVSIVVPAYNSVNFIDAALTSIFSQTYTDFELIISDHSSTDGTWERIRTFESDRRVRTMQIPPGGGAPANWTAVTEQAGGELIKLVCGDDLLYPDSVAAQVEAFDQHPEAVLVASQRNILDEAGSLLVRGRGVQGLHGLVDGRTAIRRTVRSGTNVFGEPVCVMVKREVLAGSGGWDSRSPYLIDQATCARVLLHGPMVAIRRPLAGFRINSGQWSVELAREQAQHAREFHHLLDAENPGLLSGWDLRIGDARATAMAFVRRASYVFLKWQSKRRQP